MEMDITHYVRACVECGSTCFDIGAAYGYYTLALARLAATDTLVAFESDRKRSAALLDTIRLNAHIDTTVIIHNVIVGDGVSQNEMTIDDYVFSETDDLHPGS